MALIDSVRAAIDDPQAGSFQLMGEELALVSGRALARAADEWQRGLEAMPEALRARFVDEQEAWLLESHAFLRKHNRSVHTRLRGYLQLGRACAFEYPWPVVAMLGICQVLTGIGQNRLYALAAPALRRLGARFLDELVESTEDVLRRTNRGIFADSTPTVMLALRARALLERGDEALGRALLDGPLPPFLDEESRALARALVDGLAVRDREERFGALAALTLRHFGREQAIFTHHMGLRRGQPPKAIQHGAIARLMALRSVPAPVVERKGSERRVLFRPFALPPGFDVRDHGRRVELFGEAFVTSVTRDRDDYLAAVRYVEQRFG